MKKKGTDLKWQECHEIAFNKIKEKLSTQPVLKIPDFDKEFCLFVDASDIAISGILFQEEHGNNYPIYFLSKTYNKHQQNYSTIEKECLSIVYSVEYFSSYLSHRKFKLFTDNESLKWLFSKSGEIKGKWARWTSFLRGYDFEIIHIPGKKNIIADFLSRADINRDEISEDFENKMDDGVGYGLNLCRNNYNEKTNKIGYHLANICVFPEFFDSLPEWQKKDPILSDIITKILSGIQIKNYTYDRNNGILYFKTHFMKNPKICTPHSLKSVIFDYAHNSIFGGHLGINKTVKKITKYFTYPGIKKDIVEKCKQCLICAQYKTSNLTRVGKIQSSIETSPMEKLYKDFCKLNRSREGNCYIFFAVDVFSKFLWAIPTKDQKTDTVLNALTDHIFAQHGLPHFIVSDNAAIFRSPKYKNFLFKFGITYVLGTSYHPESNVAERYVQNIKTAVRLNCHHQPDMWDKMLPWLVLNLNNCINDSTKFSPAELFIGHSVKGPIEIKWNLPDSRNVEDKQLNILWEQATQNL